MAVPCVASPKKPGLHFSHWGPSVLCWQFCGDGIGVGGTAMWLSPWPHVPCPSVPVLTRQCPKTWSQVLEWPWQLQPEQVPR